MSVNTKSRYAIQSVENALEVLEAMCELGGDVSISHLSRTLDMNKSSVFRLMATFEGKGYVEPSATPGKYRMGLPAFETGRKMIGCMDLWKKAKPVMAQLVGACNESVYLAAPRNQEVVLLDMAEPSQHVQIIPMVGKRFPLERIAAGRVVLAYGKSAGDGSEWGEIRRLGACIDQDALCEGVTSLAVPLFNAQKDVAGSLCLVAPAFRLTAERVHDHLLPQLKMAGQVLSSKLGYLDYYVRR